jgi:hypothetical protein
MTWQLFRVTRFVVKKIAQNVAQTILVEIIIHHFFRGKKGPSKFGLL